MKAKDLRRIQQEKLRARVEDFEEAVAIEQARKEQEKLEERKRTKRRKEKYDLELA